MIFVGSLILTQWMNFIPIFTQTIQPSSRLELTTTEIEWLQAHPTIRVSNEMDWPPFDFVDENGLPAGYSIDLLNLVAEQMGIQFEYVNGLTWNELVQALKNEDIDLLHCSYYAEERAQFARFSKPYFANRLAVYGRRDSNFASLDDLVGKTATLIRGSNLWSLLDEVIGDYERFETDNIPEGLQAVSDGNADFMLTSFAVAQYMIQEYSIPNIQVDFFPELPGYGQDESSLHMAVHLDNSILIDIVQKALDAIPLADVRRLKNKWFNTQRFNESLSQSVINFSPSEQGYLEEKKVLKACIQPYLKPIEWIDKKGDYQGVTADIIDLVSQRIETDIDLIKAKDKDEIAQRIQQEDCDFAPNFTQLDEETQILRFTNSYQDLDIVIATRREQVYIRSMKSVSGEKVGVVQDSIYQKILTENYRDLDIVTVKDLRDGFRKLRNGQIIGLVDNFISLAYTIQEAGWVDVKISGRLPELVNLKMGIRPDNAELYQILSRAIASISAQERQELLDKWVTVQYEQGIDYGLLWRWLGVATAIILVVFYWNRQLAAANGKIRQLNQRLEVENVRMGGELEVAQRIQQMILPKRGELEAIAPLDIVGYMQPHVEVGGDYYDVLSENGVITIGMGDVTGHGFESGLVMMMTQTAIRTLKELQAIDPVHFLNAVNAALYKNLERMGVERYLTLTILNYVDGHLSIMGQHEEILLVRADGTLQRLDTLDLGMTIGLIDDITEFIAQITVELQPGDGIVLYTDGITEARNHQGEFYGLDRLGQVIQQHWSKDVRTVQNGAIADLHNFIGDRELADDITLLVLKQRAMNDRKA